MPGEPMQRARDRATLAERTSPVTCSVFFQLCRRRPGRTEVLPRSIGPDTKHHQYVQRHDHLSLGRPLGKLLYRLVYCQRQRLGRIH